MFAFSTLKWHVDFAAKTVSGYVEHDMKALKAGVTVAVFDASYLDITRIEVDGKEAAVSLIGAMR